MNPKTAEKIQNEIFSMMPSEEKLKLALRTNDRILKIARKKMKSQYPNLDPIAFSKELYKHLSSKREFYEDLFDQFVKKELRKY